jgi:hypothetical protein
MHSEFNQITVRGHEQALERGVRRAFLRRARLEGPSIPQETVVLRLCTVHDDARIDRLAELEGRPPATGRHVVAEIGGTIVAALPLGCGSALADPFRSTEHLMPLLELRAKQLGAACERRRGSTLWSAVRSWSRA